MFLLRRCHRLLRTALLVLLAFGLVATPMLGQLGDLHGVGHAVMAGSATHGHSHDTDLSAADHHHHDGKGNPEQTEVAHDLLHSFTGVTLALPDAMLPLSALPVSSTLLPIPETPWLPGDPSSLPFRPPIA